jgi:hypothetical protein
VIARAARCPAESLHAPAVSSALAVIHTAGEREPVSVVPGDSRPQPAQLLVAGQAAVGADRRPDRHHPRRRMGSGHRRPVGAPVRHRGAWAVV